MSAKQIVRLMNEEERTVIHALEHVEAELAEAAERVSRAYGAGGRIYYVGAGTSGRIATMDAAEMPPTFGVDPGLFQVLIAGGASAGQTAVEDAEDNVPAAISDVNSLHLSRNDILIGIAASGTTPYVVAAVRHARQKGVWTVGIANNRATPLLQEADLGVFLDTGPEVLTGSTRLKAGTAQKLALNRISTTAMVLSGKVVENLMVDVKARNAKLKDRCCRIVTELASVTKDEAKALLESHEWNIRAAVAAVKAQLEQASA